MPYLAELPVHSTLSKQVSDPVVITYSAEKREANVSSMAGEYTSSKANQLVLPQPDGWLFAEPDIATLAKQTLTDAPWQPTGNIAHTFVDDFYYRIHLDPAGVLNLGVVTAIKTTPVTIWNAHFDPVNINAVNFTGATNTSVKNGPLVTPFTIGPLGLLPFELNTTPNASSFKFTTLITVQDSTGQNQVLQVTGFASLLLSIEPEYGMEEQLTFRNNLLTSFNGKEQRQLLTSVPRQTFSLQYRVGEVREKNLLRNQIQSHQNKAYGLPMWPEASYLQSPVGDTDVTLSIDTRWAQYRVGDPLVVWKDPFNYSIGEIASLTTSTITLVDPIGKPYPANVLVMPVLAGQVLQQVAGTRRHPEIATLDLTLSMADPVPVTGYSAVDTYDGLPVITDRSFSNVPVPTGQNIDHSIVDTGLSRYTRESYWDHAKEILGHQFIRQSKEELWQLRQFVFHMKGRHESIWVPTFESDFVLVANVLASDTSFDIVHTEYTALLFQNSLKWRNVRIQATDGTVYYRAIINAEELTEDTERIQLSTPLGVAYDMDDLQISLMRRMRSASDRTEFQYRRWDETNCVMSFTGDEEAISL